MRRDYRYVLLVGLAVLGLCGCTDHEQSTPVDTPAVVPGVTGTNVDAAVRAMESAGLHPVVTVAGQSVDAANCPHSRVQSQDTAAEEQVVRGTTVLLRVDACGPITTPIP